MATDPVFPKILHTIKNLETNPPGYTKDQDEMLVNIAAIDLQNLPKALRQTNNWLLWNPKISPTKPDKIIKAPRGGKGWQEKTKSYKEILKTYCTQIKIRPTGLGFTLTQWHPYVVIDIDSLTSTTNTKLIHELNSYTELSPSRKGAHIWLELSDLTDKSKLLGDYGTKQISTKNKRDLFISSGYVTMTGNPYQVFTKKKLPTHIRKISYTELTKLLSKYFTPKIQELPQPQSQTQSQTQSQLSDQALKPELIYSQYKGKKVSPQSTETVRALLRKIDVVTLTEDIFDRVYHPIKLAILDPKCEDEARTPWLTICQAVHHNFQGSQDGLLLLHEWSRKGNKYDKSALNSVYQSFSTEPQFLNPVKPVTIASLISLVKAQNPEFADVTPKGKPLGTIENLHIYFDFFKFQFKYNIITTETEVVLPETICDTLQLPHKPLTSLDATTRVVSSELLKLGFSVSHFMSLRGSIEDRAKQFAYNPIEDYFTSLENIYDPTQDPFQDLLATISLQEHAKPLNHKKAIGLFIRKWLIQVAAAACTSTQYSTRIFNNLLIFTGAQGIGKTRWVQALFPEKIKHYCAGSGSLDVQNFRTDKVKQAIELQGTLICNINEVDTLFQPKKYSAFKQLLDENTNKMVMPYGREATTMVRRTVFIGSTNKDDFLVDQTGNRRITLIPSSKLEYEHTVDLDQLWAHVMHWYNDGEKWWLDHNNPDENAAISTQKLFNNHNMYIGDEFLVEDFDSYFDTESKSIHYTKWTYKQVRQVIPSLAQLKINSKDFKESRDAFVLWLKQTKFGRVLPKARSTRAAQFYLVPPLRTAESTASFRQAAQEYKDNEELQNRS